MPVVTAGVHPPGMRRTERDAAFLFYGQRIHITAKSGGIRFARVKIGQHGTAARRNDPAAQRRQPIQQIGLSFAVQGSDFLLGATGVWKLFGIFSAT